MVWKFPLAVALAISFLGLHPAQAEEKSPSTPGSETLHLAALVPNEHINTAPLSLDDNRVVIPDLADILQPGEPFDTAALARECCLSAALQSRDPDTLACCYSPGDVLALAIGMHDPDLLQRLLDAGVDANAAVDRPAPRELLSLFENPRVPDSSNAFILRELAKDTRVTPLIIAVLSQQTDAVRILLHHGANTEICTRGFHWYPLDFAAELKNITLMQLLLGQEPTPDGQGRHVIICISMQKAWLMRDSDVVMETAVSTGRPGFPTRTGEFVVTQKYTEWKSTLYKASMPNFMRLNCSQAGLHGGYVPGVPASHGCIRLPPAHASAFYSVVRLGDRVSIVE